MMITVWLCNTRRVLLSLFIASYPLRKAILSLPLGDSTCPRTGPALATNPLSNFVSSSSRIDLREEIGEGEGGGA